MKEEFRLVLFVNGSDARNFTGGRAAASPLAYYFYLNNPKKEKSKVLLGGSFKFQGLGKHQNAIKEKLKKELEHKDTITLPIDRRIEGEDIHISKKAYIYQNHDPLFDQAEHEVYWEATIEEIGILKSEKAKQYRLPAVQIGLDTHSGQGPKKIEDKWVALVSQLERFNIPVEKDNCQWKVYGPNYKKNEKRRFWGPNGMPNLRQNAFVHATKHEWKNFAKWVERNKTDITDPTEVIDDLIKNNRIHESLVHTILKMIFARDGWWVNFEVSVPLKRGKRGRIDFLVKQKQSADDPWKVIEVKLKDNPDAVEQLHDYLEGIEEDVKKEDVYSYFWPLWNGKGKRPTKPKGIVLCAKPGKDTREEAEKHGYDVWTYEIINKNNKLELKIWDATNNSSITET